MTFGRDRFRWVEDAARNQSLWDEIDKAVHDECERIKRGAKFIPPGPMVPGETFVPADVVEVGDPILSVDEAKSKAIVELEVEFTLTPQQVGSEEERKTAASLATRAATLLSQGQDVVLFQGQPALDALLDKDPKKPNPQQDPLFKDGKVRAKSGPAGEGLLQLGTLRSDQIIPVERQEAGKDKWGEHTSDAVGQGYAKLQDKGHYGPYALVLHTLPHADTHTALANTLIMPADRIKPMVTAGFYGSGALPELTGILVSIGGNSLDLVRGQDAIVAYLYEDKQGHHFRLYERFALRLKNTECVMKLDFDVDP